MSCLNRKNQLPSFFYQFMSFLQAPQCQPDCRWGIVGDRRGENWRGLTAFTLILQLIPVLRQKRERRWVTFHILPTTDQARWLREITQPVRSVMGWRRGILHPDSGRSSFSFQNTFLYKSLILSATHSLVAVFAVSNITSI